MWDTEVFIILLRQYVLWWFTTIFMLVGFCLQPRNHQPTLDVWNFSHLEHSLIRMVSRPSCLESAMQLRMTLHFLGAQIRCVFPCSMYVWLGTESWSSCMLRQALYQLNCARCSFFSNSIVCIHCGWHCVT